MEQAAPGREGTRSSLDSSQRGDFCHKTSLIGSVFSGLVTDWLTFLFK